MPTRRTSVCTRRGADTALLTGMRPHGHFRHTWPEAPTTCCRGTAPAGVLSAEGARSNSAFGGRSRTRVTNFTRVPLHTLCDALVVCGHEDRSWSPHQKHRHCGSSPCPRWPRRLNRRPTARSRFSERVEPGRGDLTCFPAAQLWGHWAPGLLLTFPGDLRRVEGQMDFRHDRSNWIYILRMIQDGITYQARGISPNSTPNHARSTPKLFLYFEQPPQISMITALFAILPTIASFYLYQQS